MVDIHHHLLFGLDDGSPDVATSIAMARMAVSDGITHVVCTPHASGRYEYVPEIVQERAAELRAALAEERVDLQVGVGCDFHLSYDNIQDALEHRTRYTVNGTQYLLVELPDHGIPQSIAETFYELQIAGMVPILTHPERNPTLQRDHDRLAEWMRNGMLVQVTASSVLGRMGKEAERMSHKLLADRWVHFLATDAHNVTSRPPQMSEARAAVAAKYGQAYAERLCVENPRAVFEGQALPAQDEPRRLFEEDEAFGGNRPWWKRMFGR